MTVEEFTNKAIQKISELGDKIVVDYTEANDYLPEVELLLDLSDFVENLNDPLNDWSDNFINKTMEYYAERANLDKFAVISWLGYTYNIGLGGGGNGVIGADGRGIASVTIVDGDLIITYTDGSQSNSGPVGVGANIFVTNVEAVNPGKSVSVNYKSNIIEQNVVDRVATDDTQIRIYIWWDGGKEWNGTMIANSTTLFPNTDRISNTERAFTADAVVDVDGLSEVVIAGNGGSTVLPIDALTPVPTVTGVSFGSYPVTRGITQTELKDADQIRLTIDLSDSSNVESIIVENDGNDGFLAGEIIVTDIGNNQVQCFVTSDHNFQVPTSKGIKFRLKTFTGSEGSTYDSTGTAEVTHNNVSPDISFNSITYPVGQSALKDSETADVDVSVSGHDEIDYQDTLGQVSIPSQATYSQVKTVTRVGGQYNISLVNYTIVAYRNANGSQSTLGVVVWIAHAVPTIDISVPEARLISGGNDGTEVQDHVVTVTSNQVLSADPTLGADIGTLQDDMTDNGSMSEFYETLQIHDNDAKGNGTFTISVNNLAGRVSTTINSGASYVSGGFVRRRKYFVAFTNTVQMGVGAVDTSKVNAWDKDLIAMTYVADQNVDEISTREFTLTTTTDTNDTIHWNDSVEIQNNTTGLSFIEIEEVA